MNKKLRQQLTRRGQRLRKRIDPKNWNGQSPMFDPPAIHYELAERTQAVSVGGLGVVQQLVKRLGLAAAINRTCPIFRLRLPYSEADHVLNIAYNVLAGGTCLEHLELRRTDEAYLNAVGAQRRVTTERGRSHHGRRFLSTLHRLGRVRTDGVLP